MEGQVKDETKARTVIGKGFIAHPGIFFLLFPLPIPQLVSTDQES